MECEVDIVSAIFLGIRSDHLGGVRHGDLRTDLPRRGPTASINAADCTMALMISLSVKPRLRSALTAVLKCFADFRFAETSAVPSGDVLAMALTRALFSGRTA